MGAWSFRTATSIRAAKAASSVSTTDAVAPRSPTGRVQFRGYPDNMPQAITVIDAQGRCAVYVPLRVNGKIVVPEPRAH